ncbi:T-complex protein 1 subunit theta-like protein, partial [Tanacetum coccineum]
SDEQLERAVVNVVNTYKALCRDSRIVPGAGATEIEIARLLKEFAFKETRSSNHIVIAKYAESFELIPKTLAHNANLNVEGIIETLYADHAAGNVKAGIDYKNEDCKDASTLNIWDLETLYADHAAGNVRVGIDLKNEDCKDASTMNIWDLYTTK